ncbi:MAG: hypothetical protein DRN96_06610 [Thermoproteota archaeon]|nr:MAG: hypothetical protein DRN96_06610 [Candidatus Korarchaeota archaeon]RLG54093.1 MAG: hypothetical protein DRN99_05670 [Candidatus Korarchaeota archaeon]
MPTLDLFLLIFALVVILLLTERYHRCVAAMIGAFLVVVFSFERHLVESGVEVLEAIDMETLGFIVGIMMLCEGLARSGLFEFIGLSIAKATGGRVTLMMASFMLMTVLLTAFVGNITAMIIVGSLTIAIGEQLKLDLKRWLLAEAIIVDVGGLAFPISSIPSLIIASKTGWGFQEFIRTTLPLVLALTLLTVAAALKAFKPRKAAGAEVEIDPWSAVEDRRVFYRATLIFASVMLLLVFKDRVGLSLELIAFGGAVLMLALSGEDPDSIFRNVDWSSVFFLASFYIIVGGMEKAGVMGLLASATSKALMMAGRLAAVASMLVCAIASAFIDNIPVTLLLLSMSERIAQTGAIAIEPLTWSILFGAITGGKLTSFGSPSTIVAMGMLKRVGAKVTAGEYMKTVAPFTLLHLLVSSAYTLLFL